MASTIAENPPVGPVQEEGVFLVRKGVPILDEHEYVDSRGQRVVVNESRLQQIAAKCNARVRSTGDSSPIVIGHTKDGLPEVEQPTLVGFARDYYVDDLRNPENGEPTGRKAIHATFKVFKRDRELVNKHPRRSVEFWENSNDIDPISLLGATTPQRDLGLVFFQQNGRKRLYERDGDHKVRREFDAGPLRFDRETPMADMTGEDDGRKIGDMSLAEFVAAFSQSDWAKGVEAKLAEVCPPGGEPGAEGEMPGGEPGGEDDLLAPASEHDGGGMPPEEEDEARQGHPDQMNAGMGYPGPMSEPPGAMHAVESDPAYHGSPAHGSDHMMYGRGHGYDPYAADYGPAPYGHDAYGYPLPVPARPAPRRNARPAAPAPARKPAADPEKAALLKRLADQEKKVTQLEEDKFKSAVAQHFSRLTGGDDPIDFGTKEEFQAEAARIYSKYRPAFDYAGLAAETERIARHYKRKGTPTRGGDEWAMPPELLNGVMPVQYRRQEEARREQRPAEEQERDKDEYVEWVTANGLNDLARTNKAECRRRFSMRHANNGAPVKVR